MRVVWSSLALRQVWRAYDDLAEFNLHAAGKLAAALIAAGETLAHFPYRGRLVPGTAMRELTAVHRYIIRYEIVQDEVWILRVRHAAQRPTQP